jgi:predicted HTH transcriptional regulator
MHINELIGNANIENSEVDYKLKYVAGSDALSWLKTVGGYANCHGGRLIFGVRDSDHEVVGFDEREVDQQRNLIVNAVNQEVYPVPGIDFSFVPYETKSGRRYVLCMDVAESRFKPVTVKHKGAAGVYMRRDGFSNPATYEEIYEMAVHSREAVYDSVFTDEAYVPSDFTQLSDFYQRHTGRNKGISQKTLISDGFLDSEGYLSKGALLFSDRSNDSNAIQLAIFNGTTRGSDIVSISKTSGPLTKMIDEMELFVKQHMNQAVKKLSDSHRLIPAYPDRALFEGIINSVAHRDYTLPGSIQVDMFRDRLEISSPGAFYKQGDLQKTYDLSSIISQRRNPVVCNVLVRCMVMEASGTGFERIVEEYHNASAAHRPYIFSKNNQFTLVLPDLTYAAGVADSVGQRLVFDAPTNATKHDDAVIRYCYGEKRSAKEIAAHLGISDSAYLRTKVLGRLVKLGYLTEDQGRPKRFTTSDDKVMLRL